MKNLLRAMIMATAALLTAGCVTHVIADKQPAAIADARPTPLQIPAAQTSPDVNFKASNTMPGEPPL
jgi:hypothetical protein